MEHPRVYAEVYPDLRRRIDLIGLARAMTQPINCKENATPIPKKMRFLPPTLPLTQNKPIFFYLGKPSTDETTESAKANFSVQQKSSPGNITACITTQEARQSICVLLPNLNSHGRASVELPRTSQSDGGHLMAPGYAHRHVSKSTPFLKPRRTTYQQLAS